MGHLPYLHFLCVWLHGCTVYVAVLFAGALPVLLYVACLRACSLGRLACLLLMCRLSLLQGTRHCASILSRRLSRYLAIAAVQHPPPIPLPPGVLTGRNAAEAVREQIQPSFFDSQ
jgi:hypothetical protein